VDLFRNLNERGLYFTERLEEGQHHFKKDDGHMDKIAWIKLLVDFTIRI